VLANLYLHHVLDLWVQHWRKRQARGEVLIVRYADDFVLGFQHREDAERLLVDLRERFAKFGLQLHPEKTRLIEFGRFAAPDRTARGDGKPETFNFLGFTHICAKTRNAKFCVLRQTMRKRLAVKLHEVKAELQRRRHDSIPEQGAWLGSVVRGYFAYHAVPRNRPALRTFHHQVGRLWGRSLRRRSQKHRMTAERVWRLVNRYLPPVRILHPYPNARFAVRTQGGSRMR
jgi:hypothetical protein